MTLPLPSSDYLRFNIDKRRIQNMSSPIHKRSPFRPTPTPSTTTSSIISGRQQHRHSLSSLTSANGTMMMMTTTTSTNKENSLSTCSNPSTTSFPSIASSQQSIETKKGDKIILDHDHYNRNGDDNRNGNGGVVRGKKRAYSLGGETLQENVNKKTKEWDEIDLSPGKLARRRAAPRRSILRAIPAIFDPLPSQEKLDRARSFATSSSSSTTTSRSIMNGHTTDLSFINTPSSSSSVTASVALSQMQVKGQGVQSFGIASASGSVQSDGAVKNRRRSSIKFTPDSQSQQTERGQHQHQHQPEEDEDEEDDEDDEEEGSMEMDLTRIENMTNYFDETNSNAVDENGQSLMMRRKSWISHSRRVSFAPNAHIRTFTPDKPTQAAQQLNLSQSFNPSFSQQQYQQEEEEEEEEESYEESEPSMELAGDEITLAFAGHFAGTVLPVSAVLNPTNHVERGQQQEEEEEEELEVTRKEVRSYGPRPSEVRRIEDEDDELIMKELGFAKGNKKRASVMFTGVEHDDEEGDEDAEMEEGDTEELDRTIPMDQTIAIGRVIAQSQVQEEDDEEDSNDEEDELSIAMDLTGRTDLNLTSTSMMDVTTSFGGIVSAPSPSTPLARQRAQTFARQVAAGLIPAQPSPIPASPRRVVYPGQHSRSSLAPRSPGRGLAASSLSQSVTKSPGRAIMTVNQPNFVGAKSPRAISPAAQSRQTTPERRKSLSPVKKATTPRSAIVAPMTNRAPSSIGRPSPGRALSLRGILHEQQLSRANQSPHKSTSPAKVNWAASPVRSFAVQPRGEEEDSTSSSFGETPQEPLTLSLNDFFKATGTAIMKDVIAMTGVDLTNRRKSIAPSSFNSRETSGGAPSFADLAVAGGCKSLFYQLYQNDHARLHEDITAAIDDLAEVEIELERNQPQVFQDWLVANDQVRSTMQVQFNMIKRHYHLAGRTDWNECRTTNYDSIIGVMEDNLEGLRADNAIIEETRIDQVLPELQARRQALLEELHNERQRDLELLACDQDELKFAHESLQEQAEQIEHLELGHTQIASQLTGLVVRCEALQAEVDQATRDRDALARSLEEGRCFTKAEVFRLQAEYDALQRLSGWQMVSFSGAQVRLVHLDEVVVSLKLGKGKVESVEMELIPNNKRQMSKDVTRFLFKKMVANIEWVLTSGETDEQSRRAKSILQRIASLWTSIRHLRHEIQLTHLRYPTTTSYDARHDVLRTAIEIHVAKARSTFYVVLELTGEEIVSEEDRRPIETGDVIAQVGSEVVVKFGKSIDTDSLKYIVRERLDQGGRGALIEACYEAEAQYSA